MIEVGTAFGATDPPVLRAQMTATSVWLLASSFAFEAQTTVS